MYKKADDDNIMLYIVPLMINEYFDLPCLHDQWGMNIPALQTNAVNGLLVEILHN